MAPTTSLGKIYRRVIPTALDILTNRLNKHLMPMVGTDLDGFHDTVSKTKFLAMAAPLAFKDAAEWHGIDYEFVNETGYDTVINYADDGVEVTVKIEDKMSLMESTDSFATGNNHSKVKDYLHFVLKLQHVGNIFTSAFAAVVDVPALQHEQSGWDDTVTKTKKNNNGFSSLKVHISDACHVNTIYGNLRTVVLKKDGTPSKRKLTYCQTEYETLSE